MDELVYVSKSPDKSSPSFPEDVEDDEDEQLDLDPPPPHLTCNPTSLVSTSVADMVSESNPNDVTMLAEEDEDEIVGSVGTVRGCTATVDSDLGRSFTLHSVDSPRHPIDSSEKKVHWSNHHVQTLLDCVEKHLDEFNIQKKHKQVWQTIGVEMESFGFTMEHCYNKWKNLRRDVRLLVNNPQKVVRNADILRRVARLILVIHPNIDATTMQVVGSGCASLLGDRNGRSAPNTPLGPGSGGLSGRGFVSSSLHIPNSPRYVMNSSSTTSTPNSHHYHHHSNFRHTQNGGSGPTIEDIKSLKRDLHDQPPPSTALFINLGSDSDTQPERKQQQIMTNHHHLSTQQPNVSETATTSDEGLTTTTTTSFPFFFSPAAAALLVQSQLLNDLLRQQQGDDLSSTSPEAMVTGCNTTLNSTPKPTMATNGGTSHLHQQPQPMQYEQQQPTADVITLATTLLNGLSSVTGNSITSEQLNQCLPPVMSTASNLCNSSGGGGLLVGCHLPPGSELAGIVERLREEETVHLRLTDLVSHLAHELRAAGLRRRETLDRLLSIIQTPRMQTSATVAAGPLVTNSKQSAAAVTKQTPSHD